MGQLPCKFDDCIGRLNLTNLVSYHASLKMMVLMAKMLKKNSYHASPNIGILANFMSELMGQLPCMSEDCIGGLNLINSASYHAS